MVYKMNKDLENNALIKSLLTRAYVVATQSPDPSSQNGAVLFCPDEYEIMAEACNTFPSGINQTSERWNTRELKYKLVDHAEASVLLTAFRNKVFNRYDPAKMWLVCPWAACCSCAKHIIGFGVKRLITHKQGMMNNHGHWVEETTVSKQMFLEAGVIYEEYDGFLDSVPTRRDGKLVTF